MTLPPQTVIAGYVIQRTLGAGGMGTVYLARHPSLPRNDALKVLSAELSADPRFRARFNREAELAATLDHPNIVRVYSRGETEDGRLWISMQFVDGTDAREALKAGPMPIPRVVHIISEVAKALDYAHSRNLLHRDVKPANFLLSGPVGPSERVLLADFGIARALDDATRLTATGVMMATVAYAPPEAIEGRPVDARSDVYSLGCSLYRMLTGATPFQGADSMAAAMLAHVTQPPPQATALAPGLPPAIDAVIATAMAKDPAQRYQSATDLANAAAAALLGTPAPPATGPVAVSGPNPTLTYPSGMVAEPTPPTGAVPPPYPAYAPPATPTAPTVIGAPTPFGHGAPPPGPAATPVPAAAAAKTPISRRTMILGAAGLAVVVAGAGIVMTRHPGRPAYPARDFVHTFGTTHLDGRPDPVAALGPGDADAALSLGVQPAAMVLPGGRVPGWLTDLVHGNPAVMDTPSAAAVGAVRPGVIIDTAAGLPRGLYDSLAAVAPTVTRPTDGQPFTPARQLSWIADITGTADKVAGLREQAAQAEGRIRTENPAFAGTQVAVLTFTDAGLSAQLSDSPAARYLAGVGLTYTPKFASKPGEDKTEKPIAQSDLFAIQKYVSIVLRTDKAAGGGGFAGLPPALEYSNGPVVVVDDLDTVAALLTAGPAATRFLDSTFIPKLAGQLK